MLEFLLLLVYTIGAGYTTLVLNNGVFYLYQFNLLSIISPFMWIHLFFLLSGWYIFTLLLLTIYYCLTKERVKKCYGCRITYKKSDRYCEKCGTTIFYSFELKNQYHNQKVKINEEFLNSCSEFDKLVVSRRGFEPPIS